MNRVLIYGAELGLGPLPLLLRSLGVEATATSSHDMAEAALSAPDSYAAVLATLAEFLACRPLQTAQAQRIAVAEQRDIDGALDVLGSHIDDCLFAPITTPDLLLALRRPRAPRHCQPARVEEIIGVAGGLATVWKTLERAAGFEADVLISGESGTGKELFARALHDRSNRREAPFVAINCAAIPQGLLESQLFGHVRGAFTDAHHDHPGVFARAHGGTLFLDEIGDFPLEMQVKLLRALQTKEIQPVGSETLLKVDVRVVSATSRDLEAMMCDKRFRDDLYYRLAVIPIHVPPLRERRQDLDALLDHFLRRFADKHQLGELALAAEARELLLQASWPGNVRQLQNTIERLVVLVEGTTIDAELVESEIRNQALETAPAGASGIALQGRPLKEAMRSVEAELIAEALALSAGKRSKCAELLSISPRALLYKIKEHDL